MTRKGYRERTRELAVQAIQERDGDLGERVVVRFADDELLDGVAGELDLDSPDFTVAVSDMSNNSEVVIPWVSVKTVLLRREECDLEDDRGLRKVAIHFWGGEVLRGYVDAEPQRHRHGMALPLMSPTLDEIEVFGIPYAAVKGLFFVKSWDSRQAQPESQPSSWFASSSDAPLLDILSEIRLLSTRHVRGELNDVDYQRRRREVLRRL
ncbi:MAG: hypothetical protein JOY68_03015 [Candidatus Dormibacteraeota bacterium]|nr:hypothetical protein [Candidatus Dormibacteraeota bacterium]